MYSSQKLFGWDGIAEMLVGREGVVKGTFVQSLSLRMHASNLDVRYFSGKFQALDPRRLPQEHFHNFLMIAVDDIFEAYFCV